MKIVTIFTLLCIGIVFSISLQAQTILYEDFSSGSLPTGWSTTQTTGSVGWQFGIASQAVEKDNGNVIFAPPASVNNMAFDLSWNDNDSTYATEDRLITPNIDLSSYTGSKVYFAYDAYFLQDYSIPALTDEFLNVDVSTDNGTTWNYLQSISGNGSLYHDGNWHNCYIDASAYAGQSNVMLSFHYNDMGSHFYGAAVANVQIFSPAFLPTYRLVFEESTGMWCGFCPAGIVYLDSLEKVYPNTAITIAVHNNDALSVHEYDSCENAWPGGGVGYPGATINRLITSSAEQAFLLYSMFIDNFGVANVTIAPSYNSSTRLATVNVGADFAVNLAGPCNFALVFTEDSVMGNNASYNQNNYYAGGTYGNMGNFQNLPDPVPYNEMYYPDVARAILGTSNTNSYLGNAGSITSPIIENTIYTYQFTYTVPTDYNASRMKAIALLLDAKTGDILNSISSPLITTGISELNSGVSDANIFPNPSNTNFNVGISLNKSEHVVITLSDVLGRTVATKEEGNLSAGEHNYSYDASVLSSGIYLVTIKTNDGQVTRKIIKQ